MKTKNLTINDKLIAKYELADKSSQIQDVVFIKVLINVCQDWAMTEQLCFNLIEFIEQRTFGKMAYLNID